MHKITAVISKQGDSVEILIDESYVGRIKGPVTIGSLGDHWRIRVDGGAGRGAYLWADYIQQGEW